jgi:hypothetical protein
MRLIRTIFLFLAIFIIANANGQPAQSTNLLPVISPASPDVAGIARFGNYQVNLFTGIPDISIPLYEIQLGSIKVPITLSYHAGGIKVTDIPTRLGLGWSLIAGGVITRKIQGIPDDQPNGYFLNTTTLPNCNLKLTSEIDIRTGASMDYVDDIRRGVIDGEPDIFSYSFPGHNGKFLFDQRNNLNAIFVPYAPIKVSRFIADPYSVIFDLTDESGIIYKFHDYEWTSAGSGVTTNAVSSWLLSSITTPNLQDSIKFNYSSGTGNVDTYFSDYWVVNDHADGAYSADMGTPYRDLAHVSTTWQQLNEIDFPGGKVVFESDPAGRADFNSMSLPHRLNAIKVYSYDALNNTYFLNRQIQFNQSYFINGTDQSTGRLKLDNVQIKDANSSVIQTYQFNYNTSISLPVNTSCMKDYWGYFNNQSNTYSTGTGYSETTIPNMTVPYQTGIVGTAGTITIGGPNSHARDVNPSVMQAYILQQIIYPTGGNTQFEYETNQYLDGNNVAQYAGGLRIKSIKSYDGINPNPIVKTYKYGDNESGYGRANFFLETYLFTNVRNYQLLDMTNPSYPAGLITGHVSTETYFGNPTNDIENYDGSPVVYSTVTEYNGDGTTNNGKTIYQFTDHSDAKTDIAALGRNYFDSYHFIRGLLTQKIDYRKNVDGTYSKVKELRKGYQFQPFQWSSPAIGIVVQKTLITNKKYSTFTLPDINLGTDPNTYNDLNNYRFNNYNLVSGDNKLVAETNILYDQSDPTKSIVSITNYTYDDLTHLGLSQVQTTNSKNELLKTTFTYPYNYPSTIPYSSMNNNHIWDKVVNETTFNGSTQLFQQTNNYLQYSNNNFLPQSISIKIKSNPVETRANFNNYDFRGSILEMQKTNDLKMSFIYDYKFLYPIAQVTNASQNDIAYTSFESAGNGGWSGIQPSKITEVNSLTGKRSYTDNFSFSKTISSANDYIVSYWSINGSYSVNATSGTLLRTIGNWNYYEHKVTLAANGTITITGNGTIDELRLYPATSQMVTYTYDPLVGVTSECDANSRIIFNSYDPFGRLVLVRDDNKNILKKVSYNYNSLADNSSLYSNNPQNGTFTKSCGFGTTGTQITYSVQGGIYFAGTQAAADALALNDVNTNGPAYANLNGTCYAGITGSNSKSISYSVKFTDVNSGANYTLSLSSGASNLNIGQVPIGTYNVQFQPNNNPPTANFSINSYTITNATGALFNNVAINTASTVSVY